MKPILVVLSLAVLTGCAGARLSSLQSEFNELYARAAECAKSPTDSLDCTGQDLALHQLALDAEEAAGKADDPRTQIALLRLAGVAAWQSHGARADAQATKIALAGEQRCDALDSEVKRRSAWGAPRDCALLLILPGLVAHDQLLEQLAALETAQACTAGDVALADLVDTYADATVLFLEDRKAKALGYQGISPSTRAYFEESQKRMVCNFERVRRLALDHCSAQAEPSRREKERIEQRIGTSFAELCL